MSLLRSWLVMTLLAVGCFSLATRLQPWAVAQQGDRDRSGGVLQILFGDGRRLFANHFFAKADAYFHRGAYPSIFDIAAPNEEMHMVTAGQSGEPPQPGPEPHAEPGADHHHEHDEASHPAEQGRDWIERMNLHFSPASHEHLGGGGEEREILPWLRLSAELDPQRVQTYTVAAYWLRTRLGRADEAEQFLRDGLRHNPDSPEILFELGQLYEQNRHDLAHARNLWELALDKWRRQDAAGAKPDAFIKEQVLVRLARLEERAGHLEQAIRHLEALKSLSPSQGEIDKEIAELQARLRAAPSTTPTNATPRP